MILVDFVGHMASTESEEELHRFALDRLSMEQSWYQASAITLKHPHYDLTSKRMVDKAIECGAEWVTPQDLVRRSWWNKKEKK